MTMSKFILQIFELILLGILPAFVLVLFGELSGNEVVGWIFASAFGVSICAFMRVTGLKFAGYFLTGLMMILPIWLIFAFMADPGELERNYPGLIFYSACCLAGLFMGPRFRFRKNKLA